MSKFRPQMKGVERISTDQNPAAKPTQPEVSDLANRREREIDELRLLSGIGVAPVAAPAKTANPWLPIANLVAALACLILGVFIWARLNAVEASLRDNKRAYETAAKAARDSETSSRAAESAVKSLEGSMESRIVPPSEHTVVKKRAVQKRK